MQADDSLWDDFDDESSCLDTEECISPLIKEASDGCLYCALRGIGEDDD